MNGKLLQESLVDLYEEAPCGYIFTNPNGRIERVNRTFSDWMGYSRNELTSRSFQDILTVAGRIFYENQYAPLLRMQGFVKGVAFDLVRRDDERLAVLINSTLRMDESGQPLLIASTIFDATDRRRYERELQAARERAERFAAIVTSANDAIIRAAIDGEIETCNAAAERLFGFSAGEMTGRSLWGLLPALQDGSERDHASAEWQAGRAVYLETAGRRADGSSVDVSVGLMPHLGLLGELDTVSAIIRDISERRALERLQQEFLAMTSHELRQPLVSISGQAQLMRRRGQFSERSLDTIIEQTNRLGRLVDDLLLASLIEADRFDVRPELSDLALEARHAVEQLANDERPIHVDTPAEPLPVLVDRQRIGQAMSNLLTNAIKYSPAGSEIVVRARKTGSTACVDVIDQGDGIPPHVIPHLFQRFYRVESANRHASGLGLGLYITHRIVEAHGGSIDVHSEVGVGSTFTIALPLAGAPST
jgi:two-component system, OmpR family, sensor histidine kinase VicK